MEEIMQKEIRDLITKYLLKKDVDIDKIYDRLSAGEIIKTTPDKLKGFYEKWVKNGKNFQTDLPFWYNKDNAKNKPTIMIIAQDAYNKGDTDSKYLIVNAPFSTQKKFKKENNETSNKNYEQILSKLNEENFKIYLTDLYKLFFWYKGKILNQPFEVKSHEFPTYTYNEIHYRFLIEEINIVQPDLIVTFGGKAREAIRIISGNTIKFGANALSKDKLFDEKKGKKGYNLKKLNGKTIKYAPLLHLSNRVRDDIWKKFLEINEINNIKEDGQIKVEGTVAIIQKMMEKN